MNPPRPSLRPFLRAGGCVLWLAGALCCVDDKPAGPADTAPTAVQSVRRGDEPRPTPPAAPNAPGEGYPPPTETATPPIRDAREAERSAANPPGTPAAAPGPVPSPSTPDVECTNHMEGMPEGCLQPIGGGTFLMGAQRADPKAPGYDPAAQDDEGPPRWVRVSPFSIHFHEVRMWQYRRCVKAGACPATDVAVEGFFYNFGKGFDLDDLGKVTVAPDFGRNYHPINGVSWDGAVRYCAWIGARLPTEAEWEFAARGPASRRYAWGDDAPSLDHAVYGPTRADQGTSSNELYGSRTPTDRPVYHLGGNVWEWTADWYTADLPAAPDPSKPLVDPVGPASGNRRVIRGGGWEDEDPVVLRAAYRAAMDPGVRAHDLGFRCVRRSSGAR